METLEFQKKLNKASIMALYGNEFIYLGMPLSELNDILYNHYGVYGEQCNEGYCMFYNIVIKRSMKIHIEILKQVIYKIDFIGDYEGTYNGIGVGNTISDLLEIRSDVYFDEEYILVGKYPYDFIIRINNYDNTIYSLEEVLNNKIIGITVENKSLLK